MNRRTRRLAAWTTIVVVVATLIAIRARAGSSSQHRDFGKYRVVLIEDGLFGFVCQPHQELFFADAPLAACGTPQALGFPDGPAPLPDPNCFVFASDNSAVVYWHNPNICGKSAALRPKADGIHVHNLETGDRLVYKNGDVHQSFSGHAGDPGLHTGYYAPWDGSPRCRPILMVGPDGVERPVRPADPACR